MSMDRDAVREFLSGGAKAFSFDNMGDEVYGKIVAMDIRQQTHMETGDPLFWKNGQPRNVLVVTLQTDLSDDESDDGERTVWLRGGNYTVASGSGTSSLSAVRDAMRKANVKDIEPGGTLRMAYTGDAKPTARGLNAPKLYTAEYAAPVRSVSLDDLT